VEDGYCPGETQGLSCFAISPNLCSVRPRVQEWDGLSLIPLANLVVVRGGCVYVWVKTESGQDPRVCGRLGEVMPWLGVGYVDTVSGSIVRVGTTCYLCRVY
jgi:hypothetical protein